MQRHRKPDDAFSFAIDVVAAMHSQEVPAVSFEHFG